MAAITRCPYHHAIVMTLMALPTVYAGRDEQSRERDQRPRWRVRLKGNRPHSISGVYA